MKITGNETLAELLKINGAEAALKANGVPCMTCPLAAQEINSLKLNQVAAIYGLDSDKIISDLKNLKGGQAK